MKRYDNSGVCHAFAHAEPGESGQSQNGNLFFQGNVLYSYGSHYPVAIIIDRENRVALFNADSSSVTTEAKHKSPARRALSHFTLHSIPSLDFVERRMRNGKLTATPGDLAQYVTARADDIARLAEKAPRLRADWKKQQNASEQALHENAARIVWKLAGRRGDCFNVAAKETRVALKKRRAAQFESGLKLVHRAAKTDVVETVATIDHMADNCARANYADLCKFDRNVERLAGVFPNVILSGFNDKIAVSVMGKAWVESALRFEHETHTRNAPIHDAMLRYNAARAARIAELNKEKVTQWLAGDAVSLGRDVPMMLRIKDDQLQTSQGARVPLPDAVKLTLFAASRRMTGKAWRRNGERHHVGAFECDSITESGDIVAGCHRIPWRAIVDCVARFRAMLPDSVKNAVLDAESTATN